MTEKELERLGKSTIELLPGFVALGRLVIDLRNRSLLRGLCFERSSDRGIFYIWVFVMPMYVIQHRINLDFGRRLTTIEGRYGWEIDSLDLIESLHYVVKDQSLPFLDQCRSPSELISSINILYPGIKYIRAQQALAYSWARIEDLSRARRELEQLIMGAVNTRIPWEREIAEEAKVLIASLDVPSETRRQLDNAERKSWANLGLNLL